MTDGFASGVRPRLPSDPMQQIDLLLLEDLVPRKQAKPISFGRALETAVIVMVLLGLLGLFIHATVANTTVVVAPPPAAEAVGSAGGGAPSP